jgi:hypothetical protein
MQSLLVFSYWHSNFTILNLKIIFIRISLLHLIGQGEERVKPIFMHFPFSLSSGALSVHFPTA